MRSFAGRDILSLKDFERQEFFRVFEVAETLEPIARNRRNSDMLREKTLVTAFYQPSTRTRRAGRMRPSQRFWSSRPVSNNSTAPPVSALAPRNRAARTFVRFTTRRSPRRSSVGNSENFRSSSGLVRSNRDASRGIAGR